MNGLWTIIAALMSFLITWLSGKKLIPYLQRLKYGQTILQIGPSWHKKKQGTPTMGGIMFILGIIVSSAVCIPLYFFMSRSSGVQATETPFMITKICAGLIMALFYGIIGFIDDYIKVIKKQNKGLTPLQKLILQFTTAMGYLLVIYFSGMSQGARNLTKVSIPFIDSIDLGLFYWPIMSVIIVGIVNATNLTDGIDGLNASVTFFVGIFFMIISSISGMYGLSIESAALIGGCLGFLIWNFYPAKVFMGDTGSLFLGGMICSLGFGSGLHLVLIFLSAVYILEMFSVILQVLFFKITGGKRLFKMSPLHHHFEMLGWSEIKICVVFSMTAVLMGVVSFVLVLYGG